MRDIITPAVTLLVGVASGIYIFQPLILEQLKRDGNLNPKYVTDEASVESKLGDLGDDSASTSPQDSQER